MSHTIADIAAALGLEAFGDTAIAVTGAAEPADAGRSDIAVAMNPAYAERLAEGAARAAILWSGADWQALGLEAAIAAPRPRLAMAGLTAILDRGQGYAPGIHPSAVIDPSAEIGAECSIGPLAVIGPGARIGRGTTVGPQAFVGAEAVLGEGCALREGVRIGARVRLGARVILQPGVVIGGDGFSFVTPEVSGVERVRESLGDQGEIAPQSWVRIHSLGGVSIGDDVEIGANSCIDRGTIRDTAVGAGTKLDNLVQLGHNVVIGRDCLICGLVGVAGSSVVGDNVVLGGQTGISDNLTVGDGVITGGGTKVLSSIPAGRVMLGYPATKMDAQIETYKALRRLPRLAREVAALKKAVSKLGAND
ncbi:UDP-3-O-(3-hydroxymyristoyl)glucosamine N-acyltransferase [Rhodosalinus sp. 5P4]|uniref:UDP-3-O-(3-hydroxymyristoyl)glucosamine N-acyltransferase n=1 Tax=Rhodosalinus sp. 5P4 TaxID=3239196 RepID=UPI003525BC8C